MRSSRFISLLNWYFCYYLCCVLLVALCWTSRKPEFISYFVLCGSCHRKQSPGCSTSNCWPTNKPCSARRRSAEKNTNIFFLNWIKYDRLKNLRFAQYFEQHGFFAISSSQDFGQQPNLSKHIGQGKQVNM